MKGLLHRLVARVAGTVPSVRSDARLPYGNGPAWAADAPQDDRDAGFASAPDWSAAAFTVAHRPGVSMPAGTSVAMPVATPVATQLATPVGTPASEAPGKAAATVRAVAPQPGRRTIAPRPVVMPPSAGQATLQTAHDDGRQTGRRDRNSDFGGLQSPDAVRRFDPDSHALATRPPARMEALAQGQRAERVAAAPSDEGMSQGAASSLSAVPDFLMPQSDDGATRSPSPIPATEPSPSPLMPPVRSRDAVAPPPAAVPPPRAARFSSTAVNGHDSDTEVHIHIGRIEVTAVREREPPQRTRAKTAQAPSSLDAYLDARSRT